MILSNEGFTAYIAELLNLETGISSRSQVAQPNAWLVQIHKYNILFNFSQSFSFDCTDTAEVEEYLVDFLEYLISFELKSLYSKEHFYIYSNYIHHIVMCIKNDRKTVKAEGGTLCTLPKRFCLVFFF